MPLTTARGLDHAPVQNIGNCPHDEGARGLNVPNDGKNIRREGVFNRGLPGGPQGLGFAQIRSIANHVEPQAYIEDVITKLINGHLQSWFDDLLLWAYAPRAIAASA